MTQDRSLEDTLGSLHALHAEGTLTDGEFAAARARAIARHASEGSSGIDPGPARDEGLVPDDGYDPEDPPGPPLVDVDAHDLAAVDRSTVRIPLPPAVPTDLAPGTDPSWRPFEVPTQPPESVSEDYGALPPAPPRPTQFPGLPGYTPTTAAGPSAAGGTGHVPDPHPGAASPDQRSAGWGSDPAADSAAFNPLGQLSSRTEPPATGHRRWLAGAAIAVAIAAVVGAALWFLVLRPEGEGTFTGGLSGAADPELAVWLPFVSTPHPEALWMTPQPTWTTRIVLPADVDLDPEELRLGAVSADDQHVAVLLSYDRVTTADEEDPVEPRRQLHVFARASGRLLWTSDVVGGNNLLRFELVDGVVIVEVPGPDVLAASLVAYDADTGEELWVEDEQSFVLTEHHPLHGVLATTDRGLAFVDPHDGFDELLEADQATLGLTHATLITHVNGTDARLRVVELDSRDEVADVELAFESDGTYLVTAVATHDRIAVHDSEGGLRLHDHDGDLVADLGDVGRLFSLGAATPHIVGLGDGLIAVVDADRDELVANLEVDPSARLLSADDALLLADDRTVSRVPRGQEVLDRPVRVFARGQLLTRADEDSEQRLTQPRTAHGLDGREAWTLRPAQEGVVRWGLRAVHRGILIAQDDQIILFE